MMKSVWNVCLAVAMAATVIGSVSATETEELEQVDTVVYTLETTIETIFGDADDADFLGLDEFELISGDSEDDVFGQEFLDSDADFHLLITFTRYSDSFMTVCVILAICILISFILNERSQDEDDEEDLQETGPDGEPIVPENDDMSQPIFVKV